MDVKNIISRINNLSSKEKYHILNILKANNIEYTKNTNGYFFNFLKIDDNTLDKTIKCLELIEKNCNLIKEMDKRRNELIKYYKEIIEERLKISLEKRKNEYTKFLLLKKHETNIEHNINRIFHIRRNKEYFVTNANQAELILKEYSKSKTKFVKNSVYHRIYSTIKMNKRYMEPKKDYDENDNNIINIDDNIDDLNNIEEIDNYDDDNNIIEDTNENINEDTNDDINDDNKSELLSDEYDNNSDNDTTSENETIHSKTHKSITKEKIDINYYKNLLYQQGFTFDDNKRCFLIKELYIV